MAERVGPLERGLEAAVTALDGLGAAWALVGGLAVSLRAEPRLTRDADLAVATAVSNRRTWAPRLYDTVIVRRTERPSH